MNLEQTPSQTLLLGVQAPRSECALIYFLRRLCKLRGSSVKQADSKEVYRALYSLGSTRRKLNLFEFVNRKFILVYGSFYLSDTVG